jgi:hypothetical protein
MNALLNERKSDRSREWTPTVAPPGLGVLDV